MLYFITGNKNKFKEAQGILGKNIEQLVLDLPEIQEIDPKKIIAAKLSEASKRKKGEFIVDDVSFYLDCLGKKLPGPLIKWFLNSIKEYGVYKIARNANNYKCRAEVILGYKNKKGQVRYFSAVAYGKVVAPRGKGGFAWDKIFQPNGWKKTYAQMTEKEKGKSKIRFKAMRELKKAIIL